MWQGGDMNLKSFGAKKVETITGVKRTRLQQWMDKKYFQPSINIASGPGTRNLYSLYDIYRITAFKHIVDSGLSRDKAAQIVNLWDISGNDSFITFSLSDIVSVSVNISKLIKVAGGFEV